MGQSSLSCSDQNYTDDQVDEDDKYHQVDKRQLRQN